jgi:hypothetical protein
MKLSSQKLEKLLSLKGFEIISYFIIHRYCAYIEAISTNNADTVLISIPSSYEFRMHSDSTNGIYKIHNIDMKDDDETTDNYAGQPTEEDIENAYDEIENSISPSITGLNIKEGNIASHLEESYRRKISLYDLEKEDIKALKKLYRQLKRMRYCMQSIRYKLSVIYQNYICVLERDSSIETYQIDQYKNSPHKKLCTIIDLELFYEKTENNSIFKDIKSVKENLYKIFNKTQNQHLATLEKVISTRNILESNIAIVKRKKTEYTIHLTKFEVLLEKTINSQEKIKEQLKYVNNEYKNSSFKGLHSDSTNFAKKNKLETELIRLESVKKEVSKNMFILREKTDILYLDTDNTIFDNTVMVDAIFRNVDNLVKIISKTV